MKKLLLLIASILINQTKSSDFSPSCETSADCHNFKTSAYYCSHFKSCIHFPMYLAPESTADPSSKLQGPKTEALETEPNSIQQTLESEKKIVLNYLGKTNKIRTSNDPTWAP